MKEHPYLLQNKSVLRTTRASDNELASMEELENASQEDTPDKKYVKK